MTDPKSNGGPPIADGEVPDLAYVKFYPRDFITGTSHMTLEMRGAYITTLCVMYDRMGGFPYDEQLGAVLLRCDRRVYRRVRDDLIKEGKFFRDGDSIRNARVEREISDYVREFRRRSEAAKEREERRRLHRTSGELPANLSPTSPELPAQVPDKSEELGEKSATISTEEAAREPVTRAPLPEPEPEPDYKKEEPPSPLPAKIAPAGAPKAKREKARAVAMPSKAAWDGARLLARARKQGLSDDDARREFEAFKSYHLSKGSVFADWYAAWGTWCLNHTKRGYGRVIPINGRGASTGVDDDYIRKMAITTGMSIEEVRATIGKGGAA